MTSRNCPRVMSPRPGISTLITSAPIHARSCVAVGAAWTWPISRMRTPSRALLIPPSTPFSSRNAGIHLHLRRAASAPGTWTRPVPGGGCMALIYTMSGAALAVNPLQTRNAPIGRCRSRCRVGSARMCRGVAGGDCPLAGAPGPIAATRFGGPSRTPRSQGRHRRQFRQNHRLLSLSRKSVLVAEMAEVGCRDAINAGICCGFVCFYQWIRRRRRNRGL